MFTESDILNELDNAFDRIVSNGFPQGNPEDIRYNFPIDLENGYFMGAGNCIHLFSDLTHWAIVFENSGYFNRGFMAEIQLYYYGNCVNYPSNKYPERQYITNQNSITLISQEEYDRIANKTGKELEIFEKISPTATEVAVHNERIAIDYDFKKYRAVGIKIDNNRRLINYGEFVRYINETKPEVLRATSEEIRLHIPADLPRIMTLDKFHFESAYDNQNPPSKQETFQLIAKILCSGNPNLWKPTLKPNNHWSNWNSGNL